MGRENGVWVEYFSTPFVFFTDTFTGKILCGRDIDGIDDLVIKLIIRRLTVTLSEIYSVSHLAGVNKMHSFLHFVEKYYSYSS